jgi:hypothetical protein
VVVRNTLSLSAVAKQNRYGGQNQKLDACGLPRQNRISTTTTRLGFGLGFGKHRINENRFFLCIFSLLRLALDPYPFFLSFLLAFAACRLFVGQEILLFFGWPFVVELGFRWHACIPRLALGDRYSFTVASGHQLTCWWGL